MNLQKITSQYHKKLRHNQEVRQLSVKYITEENYFKTVEPVYKKLDLYGKPITLTFKGHE